MRLLILNDEERTAETMKSVIDWREYGIDEVYTAYDAGMARDIMTKTPVDVCLCDIEMPGENGLSYVRWMRESGYRAECIFLTCHASFDYAKEAIGLDSLDYILLPARYEEIGAAVRKAVQRIEARTTSERLQEYGKLAVSRIIEDSSDQYEDPNGTIVLLQRVRQSIMERLGDPDLSIQALADEFHLHPVYLNRIFKRDQGRTLSQFLMDQRMMLARDLLLSGKVSAAAAAERVGYQNYANFYTAFKKYFGLAPGNFMPGSGNNQV